MSEPESNESVCPSARVMDDPLSARTVAESPIPSEEHSIEPANASTWANRDPEESASVPAPVKRTAGLRDGDGTKVVPLRTSTVPANEPESREAIPSEATTVPFPSTFHAALSETVNSTVGQNETFLYESLTLSFDHSSFVVRTVPVKPSGGATLNQ